MLLVSDYTTGCGETFSLGGNGTAARVAGRIRYRKPEPAERR
jgi:hypothetical protein